jgi:iron(II)-dependent oxidoreductase
LTQNWRAAGRIGPTDIARLPSEVEWERAARGDDTREWPWGDTFDERGPGGNTAEAGLDRTAAVGLFPRGASPFGCLDMSGNVWEWTRSLGAKNIRKTILPNKKLSFEAERFFNYPYDETDGREDAEAPREFTRVLRGASFGNGGHLARCSSRGGNWPDVHYDNIGFRVVVQAAPPPMGRPGSPGVN